MQVDGVEHNNGAQSCMEKGLLNNRNQEYLTLGKYEWLHWLNLLNLCKILICITKESDSQHHSLCSLHSAGFSCCLLEKVINICLSFPLTGSLLSTCTPSTLLSGIAP